MYESILSTIGDTPLVKLSRIFKSYPFRLFGKIEAFNPGGSIKDRTALTILKKALENGDVQPGGIVVESSSGNMGIGLAQACAYLGLNLICVVDPKTTAQNIKMLRTYGAQVDLVTKPDPETGEFLNARINRVREILRSNSGAFWPDQYSNVYNPLAHHQTMHEIVEAAGGRVDYLFCATSTCGTIRGCVEYVRARNLPTRVVAVDAVGSVIFGGRRAKRLIPGHGAAVRPALFQENLADECVHVADLDCVVNCRRLVKEEAILAGGSSGAVIAAIDRVKETIPSGATCAAIFPDRGERYLDTIYSDEWVKEHFGDVSHLWEDVHQEQLCATMTF